MKLIRRNLAGILYIALGAVLFGLGAAEKLDAFWSGMGGALIAMGVVRTVRILRYSHDAAYRETVEIEANDERNQFIRNKAWAWAGYWFVMIAAVSTIAFKLMGQDLLSMASSFAVGMLMLLHWVCILVLKKKY